MSASRTLAIVIVWLCTGPVVAQTDPAVMPSAFADPNLPREVEPSPTATLVGDRPSPLTDFRLAQTYLPRFGTRGFGNHDTELTAQFAVPGWEPLGKPLLLKAGFAAHAWDGPVANSALPGAVYDFFLDLGWKPRPAEWLFLDLGVTPGLYTDLRAVPREAFRPRGRGLAIVALSERFQFVAGALAVNRLGPKLVPAGGFVWTPDERTKYQIVFPQPKVSCRLAVLGVREVWAYAAGEFGGGTWAYRRPDGSADALDLNDYRALAGLELRRGDGWCLRAEAGYVWGRELEPLRGPRTTPTDTVLARLALVY